MLFDCKAKEMTRVSLESQLAGVLGVQVRNPNLSGSDYSLAPPGGSCLMPLEY